MGYLRNAVTVVGFVLASSPLNGLAAIAPLSQSRSVAASVLAQVPGVSESESDSQAAVTFTPFIGDVDPAAVAIVGAQDLSFAQGVGKQTSSFNAVSVSATGEASSVLVLLPVSGGFGSAEGSSLFELVFDVDTASTFSLSGLVDVSSVITGGADLPILANQVLFEDVDNSTVLFETTTDDEAFALGGILNPGTYRLLASATVTAEQFAALQNTRTIAGMSSFELNFRITEAQIPEAGTLGGALIIGALCGITWWRRKGGAGL